MSEQRGLPVVIAERDKFIARVMAEDDLLRLADFMAEAIEMERQARRNHAVGKDGRARFGLEELCAAHCVIAAKEAYLHAREGANA